MQSSEDIWVKVDADRHSVRIEYVGDRSLLPEVLADLPQIQSGIHESDEVQINRDRSISSGQMHRQDAAKDVAISQHRLLTWCAIGSVVLHPELMDLVFGQQQQHWDGIEHKGQ